jgi:hypothetical protein
VEAGELASLLVVDNELGVLHRLILMHLH